MKRLVCFPVLIGILIAFSACQSMEDSLKEANAVPMTADEIKALFADKTVNGVNEKGTKWVVYYDPSGQVRGRSTWSGGADKDTGVWQATADDLFCIQFEKWRKGALRCWQIYDQDGKRTWIGRKGPADDEVDNDTWREGNVENL